MGNELRATVEAIEGLLRGTTLRELAGVSVEEVEDMLDEALRLEAASDGGSARSLVEAIIRLDPKSARAWAAWRRLAAPPGQGSELAEQTEVSG